MRSNSFWEAVGSLATLVEKIDCDRDDDRLAVGWRRIVYVGLDRLAEHGRRHGRGPGGKEDKHPGAAAQDFNRKSHGSRTMVSSFPGCRKARVTFVPPGSCLTGGQW